MASFEHPDMAGFVNYYASNGSDECLFKRTVIIAVDGSIQSERALEWYLKMCHKHENRLVLVHVPEPGDIELERDVRLTPDHMKEIIENTNKSISDMLVKYQKKLRDSEVASIYRTIRGKPGETLVAVAQKEDASLIVMGTRGLGKVRRTILGSVSDYVVQHASIPVMVFRSN